MTKKHTTLGDIIDAITITAEVCGGSGLSKEAVKVIAIDLQGNSPEAVLASLARCRRELKWRLSAKDILDRLDSDRPGANEAWGMVYHDEETTCVVTTEMQEAMRVAWPLLESRDYSAARMAFRDAYERIVSDNRAKLIPVKWAVSVGNDRSSLPRVLADAVTKGRITQDYALVLLPPPQQPEFLRLSGVSNHPLLAAPDRDGLRQLGGEVKLLADSRQLDSDDKPITPEERERNKHRIADLMASLRNRERRHD